MPFAVLVCAFLRLNTKNKGKIMTYIKGYEDGIKAVCEVLRGLADSAESPPQKQD